MFFGRSGFFLGNGFRIQGSPRQARAIPLVCESTMSVCDSCVHESSRVMREAAGARIRRLIARTLHARSCRLSVGNPLVRGFAWTVSLFCLCKSRIHEFVCFT